MTKGHPATMKVSDPRRMGDCALARDWPGMAVTVPPCGHIMVLETVSSAGIYITSMAPSLTLTLLVPMATEFEPEVLVTPFESSTTVLFCASVRVMLDWSLSKAMEPAEVMMLLTVPLAFEGRSPEVQYIPTQMG